MLDSDAAPVKGVGGIGDISGGEDVINRGLEMLIDDNSVVDRQTGFREGGGARDNANPDNDEIALDDGTIAQFDPFDGITASEALDDGFSQELDAVVAMELQKDLSDLGAEYVLQRQSAHLEQRHLAIFLASRGSNLRPDPT